MRTAFLPGIKRGLNLQKKQSMYFAILALQLFSSLASARKAGDVVPGQYILVFPSNSTAFSTDAELMGGVSAMASTYATRLGARGIQIQKTMRLPKQDHLLVKAASEAAVRAFEREGVKVFQNRVVQTTGYQSNATWAMSRLNQRARNKTIKGFRYPDQAGAGVDVHIIDT